MYPKRIASAHVEHLGDDLGVYDWARHRAHSLNRTAALVWQHCDGHTSPEQIAALLQETLGTPQGAALVRLALEELQRADLLESGASNVAPHSAIPRRRLIAHLGKAVALIPAVATIVVPSPLEAQSGFSQTFTYTGGAQSFVVPGGITRLTVNVYGAAGGTGAGLGGKGGLVTAQITVTPGETLTVVVGGAGPDVVPFAPTPAGGFNGGGGSLGDGAGGGGASEVRRGSTRLVIAGGGGGAGNGGVGGLSGGDGGGLIGADGVGLAGVAGGGIGGSQVAGGAGGTAGISGTAGTAGQAGTGGTGGHYTGPENGGGGGGGGGFFGGGGGGGGRGPIFPSLGSAGGGGGSSFTDGSATSVTHVRGSRTGSGQITLNW